MRFVHAADIHLDSPLRGLERYQGAPVNEVRAATRRALENLVQLCLDQQVDFLLIAGDIYDGDWRDYNTGLFFTQQMSRLSNAGIRVVMIRGNHDAQSQISKHLRLPEHVYDLSTQRPESKIFTDLGVVIHGRGYPQRDVNDNLVNDYPQPLPGLFNIGLLHTALNGRAGHAPYAPCTLDELIAKGYQYWALGHVHQREILQQDPWVVFSGNLQGRHIRETGAKGASLVNVIDNEVDSVIHCPVDIMRWHSLEIDMQDITTSDELLSVLQTELLRLSDGAENRLLAVRLILQGASPLHSELIQNPDHWHNEFRNSAFEYDIWLEKILFHTRSTLDISRLLASDSDDPLATLLRSLQALRQQPDELAALCKEFTALQNKLPAEYRQLEEALALDNPATLETLLVRVEQYLLPRLLEDK